MLRTASLPTVALAVYGALSGQPASPGRQPPTFHIQGIVRKYDDSIAPRTRISFNSGEFTKTVFTDTSGFYDADLPVGLYKMTADALNSRHLEFDVSGRNRPQDPYDPDLQEYERPPFLGTLTASIILNVTLEPANLACDRIDGRSNSLSTSNDDEIVCGGQDFFKALSDDGVAFELLIRYRTRRSNEQGYAYNAGTDLQGIQTPVFVAYNLFTLQADHVTYNVQSKMLKATGNIAGLSSDGVIHRAESMTFKIENGQVSPLP